MCDQLTKSSITPVFYLGGPRNGTTWLGNILNTGFDIITPSHQLHYGFVESAMCKNKIYWKGFNTVNNYIRFLELYSSSDYFLLVNGDKEYFYKNRSNDFYDFFFEMMESVC